MGMRDTNRDPVPIYALLAANAVSVRGNAMTAVAVPWFMLQTTGSAARTGLTGAVMALGAVLGAVLAALFGGLLVEGLGLVPTLVGMGVFYLILTSSMFFNPALRDMDGPAKPSGEA